VMLYMVSQGGSMYFGVILSIQAREGCEHYD
jgi:hypothetical protein